MIQLKYQADSSVMHKIEGFEEDTNDIFRKRENTEENKRRGLKDFPLQSQKADTRMVLQACLEDTNIVVLSKAADV